LSQPALQAEIHKVVELALACGQIVLESGGETHRVEEIMRRVSKGYGYPATESYVTPTGIFLTVSDTQHNSMTSIKRINHRNTDLDKITQISRLSHRISKEGLSIEHFENELDTVKKRKGYPFIIRLLFAGISASFYALLFGGTWVDFPIGFVIGIVLRLVLNGLQSLRFNSFFLNAIGGALIVFLAKWAATYISGVHTDKLIIGSIMLLVPGLAITNAIRDTMAGDLVAGAVRGVEAFYIAIAIACGAGVMLQFWLLIA